MLYQHFVASFKCVHTLLQLFCFIRQIAKFMLDCWTKTSISASYYFCQGKVQSEQRIAFWQKQQASSYFFYLNFSFPNSLKQCMFYNFYFVGFSQISRYYNKIQAILFDDHAYAEKVETLWLNGYALSKYARSYGQIMKLGNAQGFSQQKRMIFPKFAWNLFIIISNFNQQIIEKSLKNMINNMQSTVAFLGENSENGYNSFFNENLSFLFICFVTGIIYYNFKRQDQEMSAQAQRTMLKISHQLEQCFKHIGLFATHYIVKSAKYKQVYSKQFKKISGIAQKQDIKKKSKYRQEEEKMRKEIKQLKYRRHHRSEEDRHRDRDRDHKDRNRDKDRDRGRNRDQDQDRGRDRDIDRYRQSQREKRRQKQKGKYQQKQKHSSKTQEKKAFNQAYREKQKSREEQKQREKDKDKQRQKQKSERVIQQSKNKKQAASNELSIKNNERENQSKQKSQQSKLGWSQRPIQDIGPKDLKKYKILKVQQMNSDFEDENAPVKVPLIKPRQPLTPYFLFLRRNRYYIMKQCPTLQKSGNSAAVIWSRMTQQQKKPFKQQYMRACQLYAKKLQQYNAVNPPSHQESFSLIMKTAFEKELQQKYDSDSSEQQRPKKKTNLDELRDYQL